jgi:TonB family protein
MSSSALILFVLPLLAVAQVTVEGPEGDCGFSKLKSRQISHYVERGAVNKAQPTYPPAAKTNGIGGVVRVRILVNKRGQVERTCPVYAKGVDRPERSLVVTAEAAALQWLFQPNFGFPPGGNLQFDFVDDVLVFDFSPDASNGKQK